MSRVRNTIKNIKAGVLNKVITLLLPFIARTVLIKVLGSEYAGLSSLFVAILQVLNLAELGIGTAITFSLYKPAAEEDTVTIRATMNLYKKIYRIIGVVVLIIGFALMPFLSYMIEGEVPGDINLYVLYLLYLLNASLTYFLFAYKTILLEVHQKNNVISNINTVLFLFQFAYQMVVLVCFKNYYLYIAIMPFITVANNVIGAYYARKIYPQYYCKGKLPKGRRREIRKRVYGLMIQRLCATTRNSLDSIFISAYLGLNMVAIYNNYYMISNAITGFLIVLTTAMTASVGNSVATESVDKNYDDMNKINFLYMLVSGICTICLLCLYQPFMESWLGNSFLLGMVPVVLLCLYFYVLKMGDVLSAYTQGAGLWWEGRYRAVAEALLNIILNAVLGKIMGVTGIILGTLISLVLVNFFYGTTIIFKYYFKKNSIMRYFRRHLIYFIVTCFVALICYFVTSNIPLDGYFGVLLKGVICLLISVVTLLAIYYKIGYTKEVKPVIRKILKK